MIHGILVLVMHPLAHNIAMKLHGALEEGGNGSDHCWCRPTGPF